MVGQKVTDMTADTTPTTDDLLYVVNSPGGTPGSRKATIAQVGAALSGTYAPLLGFPHTVPPMLVGTLSQSLTSANRAYAYRSLEPGTITKIGLQVGVSSGNICVAVYSSTGSGRSRRPATRKATSGAIACPTSGYAEISLGGSVDVAVGDYLVISADNTTATFLAQQNNGTAAGAAGIGSGVGAYADTSHPPPASWTGAAASQVHGRSICLIGVA